MSHCHAPFVRVWGGEEAQQTRAVHFHVRTRHGISKYVKMHSFLLHAPSRRLATRCIILSPPASVATMPHCVIHCSTPRVADQVMAHVRNCLPYALSLRMTRGKLIGIHLESVGPDTARDGMAFLVDHVDNKK